MTGYVALLRGINVGTQHRVNMRDLTDTLIKAGFSNVETYIQSGNVVFCAEGGERELSRKMALAMEERFEFPVPAVIRTAGELGEIFENCPFSKEEVEKAEEAAKVTCLHVAMMASPLAPEAAHALESVPGEDRFAIRGRDVYLLLKNGVHPSKLAARLARMDASITMRNWKTVEKLWAMADAAQKR